MAKIAFTEMAKQRLKNMMNEESRFEVTPCYSLCRKIAGKLERVSISAEDFYHKAEEALIEQESEMRQCVRGKMREEFYGQINRITAIAFKEFPEFIAAVKAVATEKDVMSQEALASDPARRVCRAVASR